MKRKSCAIWMSGIALLLSVVAILIALYPDIAGNVSFKEIVEISITTTSIGVTVLLGVQIYTIISIDRKIDNFFFKERSDWKT